LRYAIAVWNFAPTPPQVPNAIQTMQRFGDAMEAVGIGRAAPDS
jgi:hypothetical protein